MRLDSKGVIDPPPADQVRMFGDFAIDELALPSASVATDLVAGEVTAAGSGSLAEAVVASMFLPGMAPPVLRDGRILVDGAVLDNLPVDILGGADDGSVIAVDIAHRRGQVQRSVARQRSTSKTLAVSPTEVLLQTTGVGSVDIIRRERAAADFVIEPGVKARRQHDRLDDIIEQGRPARTVLKPMDLAVFRSSAESAAPQQLRSRG
jgi:NTE family protein